MFLSQPSTGKTSWQIKKERNDIVQCIEFSGQDKVADSVFPDEAGRARADLWRLGKSLEIMSGCDSAYFVQGWRNDRECRMEHAM